MLPQGLLRNSVDERRLKDLGAIFEGDWESGVVSEMSVSTTRFF